MFCIFKSLIGTDMAFYRRCTIKNLIYLSSTVGNYYSYRDMCRLHILLSLELPGVDIWRVPHFYETWNGGRGHV